MKEAQLIIYGDNSGNKLPALQRIYALSETRSLIKSFLQHATETIQQLGERQGLCNFSDLLELADTLESRGAASEAASFAVTIALQVAELLKTCLEDNGFLRPPPDTSVHHFGICLGLITACLAATFTSIDDLFRLGLEAVAVAFRLGLASQQRSRRIEEPVSSWGTTFVDVDTSELRSQIDLLNESLPTHLHASIGVQTRDWATVFAPPSTLQRLHDFPGTQTKLKAFSSVHAPHLSPLDVLVIVGSSETLDTPFNEQAVVVPFGTQLSEATTLYEALLAVIKAIASRSLHLEHDIEIMGDRFGDGSKVHTYTIGPAAHLSLVKRVLHAHSPSIEVSEPASRSPRLDDLDDHDDNGIAIVGMSLRAPQADSLEDFWDLLKNGRSTYEEIPSDRFSVDEVDTGTRYGCFLKSPGLFDSPFFNVSPKEAMQMDPVQRLLLMTTYEALQQAGHNADSTSRTATFFGQTSSDWEAINQQQGIDTHYIPGTNRAFAPGRLNRHFEWTGGYYSLDTACSASATSIHLACNALISRECDAAVAGGGQIDVTPHMFAGLSSGGFLSSTTGACKTFADNADGYCRGEAVGVVVLKRYADAIRSNDDVLARIRGTARNSNGVHGSIVSPHGIAQQDLFRTVLRRGQIRSEDVSYVEMHGTGTQAGDTVEMESVMKVFPRSPRRPLHIGAVKANIGHSEAAAGIVALIKTVLMMQKRTILPQPGYPFPLNRQFGSLEKANIVIADQAIPWETSNGVTSKRIALINGFDAAGGNTSMLIEEGPERRSLESGAHPSHVVVACSGATPTALAANKRRLLKFLMAHPETRLPEIAYNTTARSMHERIREAYAVSSVSSLCEALRSGDGKSGHSGIVRSTDRSVAFVFTGQSSQYAGMGSQLYRMCPRFRIILNSYQTMCNNSGYQLPIFVDIIRGLQDLSVASTAQQQLSIVALELALAEYWRSLGVTADVVMGHSLGEYAALCDAGVLSVASALYLVYRRAELMQEKCSGSYRMLATGLSRKIVEENIREHGWACEVSCINGPSAVVLSGELDQLAVVEAELKSRGVSAKLLEVQYGFHSKQMDPILDDFEAVAAQVHFGTPCKPVASTLTCGIVDKPGVFNATYLRNQMRQPVEFFAAVTALEDRGLLTESTFVLEHGPHSVCIGLMPSCLKTTPTCFASLQRGKDDWQIMSQALAGAYTAGLRVDWGQLYEHSGDLRLLDLPKYAWDLKDYWIPYRGKSEVPAAQSGQISPSVQRLESLRREDGRLVAVFVSKTSEPVLYETVRGHAVGGVAICPASVFADMAYTAARWLFAEASLDVDLAQLKLKDLSMTQALVVPELNLSQVIRITATLETESKTVNARFQSSEGAAVSSALADHGSTVVTVEDPVSAQRQWTQVRRPFMARATALKESSRAHRMATPLLYKLFASIVEYSEPYQVLHDAYIDDSFEEAIAHVELGPESDTDGFTVSPYTFDGLVHLAGFLLNANFYKKDKDLHMANSIGSMHICQSVDREARCIVYASIRERHIRTGLSICDVYVYNAETQELVAQCNDIRFQQLPPEVFFELIAQKAGNVQKAPAHTNWTPGPTTTVFSTPPSGQGTIAQKSASSSMSETLLQLMAAEVGVEVKTLSPDTEFESLGLHSMAALKIVAGFRKRTDVELPVGLFIQHETVGRLKSALQDMFGEDPKQTLSSSPATTSAPPPEQRQLVSSVETEALRQSSSEERRADPVLKGGEVPRTTTTSGPVPEGRVILIQGDSTSHLPPLFLASVGAGTAAPYIRFPRLPDGRCIYALESPFVDNPEDHPQSMEALAESWVRSIKRLSRNGPYIIGGYSVGGAYAYEIARQLAVSGETILGLLIMDCRVPHPVPAAVDHIAMPIDAPGLTEKNRLHMTASARTMVRYDPKPFPSGRDQQPRRTHIIWCQGEESDDGAWGRAAVQPVGSGRDSRLMTFEEYETELLRWFKGKREKEDFGTNGWEKLVGGKESMVVRTVPGDHVSMMEPPLVKRTGELVIEFIEDVAKVENEMASR